MADKYSRKKGIVEWKRETKQLDSSKVHLSVIIWHSCRYLSSIFPTENFPPFASKNSLITLMETELLCTLKGKLLLQLQLEFSGPPQYTSPSRSHGNYLVMG